MAPIQVLMALRRFWNLKDGIHFMDPQTGSMNVSRYFEMVNHGMTRIMRVDDAEPTELVLKYCKEGQR